MSDVQQWLEVLDGTLSMDCAARTAATQVLVSAAEQNPFGLCDSLMQISANEILDPRLRLAANVTMKNVVYQKWHMSSFSPEQKQAMRSGLLSRVISLPAGVTRKVLTEALRVMISVDFPKQWPDLVAQLSQGLNSGQNFGGLMQVIAVIAKEYTTFRNETGAKESAPAELEELCTSVIVPLRTVFHDAVNAACTDADWEVLLSVVKTYSRITNSYLPQALVPHVDAWNSEFVTVLNSVVDNVLFPVSENGDDDDEDEEEKNDDPRQKLVRRVLQILSTFQRHHRGAVLKSLQKTYNAVRAVLNMSKCPLADRSIASAYNYIAAVGECDQGFRFIERDIKTILEKSIFPTLCMNEKDADTWWDPEEYVRFNLESDQDTNLESAVTARKSALELLKALAALEPPKAASQQQQRGKGGKNNKRNKKKGGSAAAKVNPFKSLIFSFLDKIHNSFGADGKDTASAMGLRRSARQRAKKIVANVTEKEIFGSIIAHGALSTLMEDASASQLDTHIRKYILPYASADLKQLTSARAFLLANACWALGQYADCMPESLLQTVFQALSAAVVLGDEVQGDDDFCNKPIRMAACHALRALLQAKFDGEAMKTILPSLCQAAFGAIEADAPCVDEILSVLSMAIVVSEEAVLPFALPITEHLVPVYLQMAEDGGDSTGNEILTALASLVQVISEYDFDEEEVGDDDGDAQIMQQVKQLGPAMAPHLARVLVNVWQVDEGEAAIPFQAEGGDWSGNYVPEATDMLQFILRHRDPNAQDLSPEVWALMKGFCASLPHWSSTLLQECSDCVEGVVMAAQVPSFKTSPFVTGNMSPLSQIVRACIHMFNDPDSTTSSERIAGNFCGALFRHVEESHNDVLAPVVPQLVTAVNDCLRANIDTDSKTPFLNAWLISTVGQALYRWPDVVLSALEPNGVVQWIKDASEHIDSYGTKEFDAMCLAAAAIAHKWTGQAWLPTAVLESLVCLFASTIVELNDKPEGGEDDDDEDDEDGDQDLSQDDEVGDEDDEELMDDSDDGEGSEGDVEESEADMLARYAEIALKIDEGSFAIDDDAADAATPEDIDFGIFEDLDGVQMFSNIVHGNKQFMSCIGPGIATALTQHVPPVISA